MCNICIMTKKYRSKKSTTKKYKKKRGGRDSEYETTRGNVDHRDLEIAENLNKERLCDEAIAKYTPYFDKQDGSTVGSLTAKKNMDIACKSKCENKQNCQISLQKDDPNFFKKLHSDSEGDAIYDPINEQYIRSHSPVTMNELPVAKPQIDENQLPQMKLTDKMFILPCLQEREQLNEMEQRGSIIRGEVQTAIPQGNAIYDQFWHGKENFDSLDDQRTSIDVPPLLKDITPSKTTVLGMFGKLPTCRKYTTDQKWKMYGEWANSNLSNGGTVLLITHHNRLRGLSTGDSEGALLPIKDKKQCDSYANNFCFRIHYDGQEITTEIAFRGFPDKGEFDQGCQNKTGCKIKKTGGGENYSYCCPTKDVTNIDTTLLKKGLDKSGITKPTTFYVIRHGNAIHNKPMNIKDGTQLDSPLTPLGLYQAKTLGCFLKQNYKDDFHEKDVILGTSLLSRTQLTGLAILNEIQGRVFNESNPNLFHDYNLLKQVSLNKFKAIANTKSKVSNLAIFNTFQPVSDNVSDFNTYCCSKLKLDKYVPNDNNKPSSCISTAKGGKKKKQTRKNRRKKN